MFKTGSFIVRFIILYICCEVVIITCHKSCIFLICKINQINVIFILQINLSIPPNISQNCNVNVKHDCENLTRLNIMVLIALAMVINNFEMEKNLCFRKNCDQNWD